MTVIHTSVRRETAGRYRGDALVVELHPRTLVMRVKGRRRKVSIDLEVLYDYMQKREALILLREKRAAKGRK